MIDVPPWTEEMLTDLQPGEYDFQEFKGRAFILESARGPTGHAASRGPRETIASQFQAVLSKQLSAFANASGGRLFLGIDDTGRIDGGIPVDLKGGGTRAWLEDIIPGSVEPALRAFNVFEVRRSRPGSRIFEGCAVYVIDIPASEDAPHMANDHRYYLRIAGKSRPMGHIHLQDILRRTQHPKVGMARVGPYGRPELDETDPRGPRMFLCFQMFVANGGMKLARHVGVELEVPRMLVSSSARERTLASGDLQLTQRPGAYHYFRYHPTPLFPAQEIGFGRFWIGIHARNLDLLHEGAEVGWKVYADDAIPTTGAADLGKYHVVRKAMKAIDNRVQMTRRRGRVVRTEGPQTEDTVLEGDADSDESPDVPT